MPETCTTQTFTADASGTVTTVRQCYNPLQFEILVYLAVAFAALCFTIGWKIIKTK